MKYQLENYKLNQIPKVNGAIVVMDPNTGRILALSGGYRFLSSEFNRATQAKDNLVQHLSLLFIWLLLICL